MVWTRQWICKVQNCMTSETFAREDNIHFQYYKKILAQGKKLSQLICYIWLNKDPETARELDQYFKGVHNKDLNELLFAEDPEKYEYKLLLKVFKDQQYLPIFNSQDKEFFKFEVRVDKFEGSISDPGPSEEKILTLSIPYPPRPQIVDDCDPLAGAAPIKIHELQEWLDQAPNEPPYFPENNPYIPPTCC